MRISRPLLRCFRRNSGLFGVFRAFPWAILGLGAASVSAVYVEGPEYLEQPEAAKPLEGLLPVKGVESGQGLLQINSKFLQRRHEVNFESREVEMVQYVVVGGDSTGGADSTALWQAYYTELNAYSMDMHELALRQAWLNQFIGQEEPAVDGNPGAFIFDLPFKVPDWMRRVGVDRPRLTITGSYKMVVEGSRRSGPGVPGSNSSWFPNLHMDQQPAFSVKGTIGRLISVEINSEDGFGSNLKEQLKISYRGEGDELEDDIIQEIEAGNTSLTLNGTELTGYSENHKGLFGLKMRVKFGDLEITGIASQEGGTQERQKLGTSTEAREFNVDDRNVDLWRHYFLKYDDRVAYSDPAQWTGTNAAYLRGGRDRKPIDVYRLLSGNEVGSPQDQGEACVYDENGNKTEKCEQGRWEVLQEGDDFLYDEELRMLSILGGHREQTIAVRWANDLIMEATGQTLRDRRNLILLHSKNRIGDEQLDSLMWRNVYSIGRVTAQDREFFNLRLIDNEGRERRSSDSLSYLRRLGLELFDQPGKLNYQNEQIFKFDQGILVLPCLTNAVPGGDPGNCLTPMKRVNDDIDIYEVNPDEIQNEPTTSKFVVFGRQRKSTFDVREQTHSVNGSQCFDIEQFSERLVLNGSTRLERGTDYEVIYETGQITLISPRARDPNADLDISYECNPPFQIQDKILMGARAEYKLDNISEQSLLGATVLYKSQTTTEKRPELGREPFRQFLWGFNARLAGEPELMTQMVNKIPLVHTTAKSRANLEFEIAQSRHNPNTKESAFLDNFEFSQNIMSMPIPIYSWTRASPPALNDAGFADPILDYRHMGEFFWHSSSEEQYFQIYGNTGNSYTNSRTQPILKLTLLPNDNLDGKSWGGIMRAIPTGFNNQSRKRTLEVVVRGREGRLSLDLGRVSEDISIAGINQGKPDGRLQAEVQPNAGEVTNEKDAGLDGVRSGEGEQGGRWECKPGCIYLPFAPDNRDPSLDNWVKATQGATEERYGVNGTEGNNYDSPRQYDTEDLDRSGTLDTLNRFIRYNIELERGCLASDFCEELQNGWRKYQIPLYGGGKLIDPAGQENEERVLANLKMMRVWLGYLPKRVAKTTVQIARINLMGNAWEEGERNTSYEQDADRYATGDLGDSIFVSVPPAVRDSNRLQVDVINKLEERGYKQSPNTPRERDTRTDEPLPERALVLRYDNLHAGETASATKSLSNDPKDLTMYSRLRMEIHADSNWAVNAAKYDPDQNRVSLALRLGRDRGDRESKDYYEIRIPMDREAVLDPEHRDLWLKNSFELPLAELYGLKNDELYRNFYGRPTSRKLWHPEREDSSLVITVVGDPNLSRIDWMRLSVVVDSGAVERQSGEIWVNDLRLEGVDKSSGTAMRAQLQLDFADFVNLSGNMRYTNGNFATMSEQRPSPGNAASKVDYNTNLQMFANKFMPDAWGVSLPVSLQFRGALDRPFTRPFSDLRLGGTGFWDIASDVWNQEVSSIHNPGDSIADIDARNARVYQTLQTDRVFATSYKKERRSDDFLTQTFFERPEVEYRFSETQRTEFFNESESRNYSSKLRYDLSPFKQSSFQPLTSLDSAAWAPKFLTGMTVKPLPDKFQLVLFDFTFGRDDRLVKPRLPEEPSIRTLDYRVAISHGLDLEWRPLNFMGFGYRLDVIRDFDDQHECFDRSLFEINSASCEEGFGAHRLLFDFDSKERWGGYDDDNDRDTSHYGRDYLILAREKNRQQTFHFDVNPNLLDWLTTSASFNSGYRHTINEAQNNNFIGAGQPTHFEGNADHDIRLNSGFNPTGFLSAVGGWFGGKAALDTVRKALDKWRVRNLDLTYTTSHKYNNDNFTYYRLRNIDRADYWAFQAYQMGFLYDFTNLGTLFDGEPDPRFFDHLSPPDPLLQDNFSHNVSRSYDVQSGFTVPGLNLDLSGSLRYTKQYNLYRNPQTFSDTTITWPEITVSGSLGDFAKRIPFLADDLKSLTAYSNYNYRSERRFGFFRSQSDENKQSHRFNPLIRLSANTQGNVRIENSVNLTLEYLQTYRKGPSETLFPIRHYYGYQGMTEVPKQERLVGGQNNQDGFSIGDEFSVSYDVETQKGVQFWRYYVKLKNNLRMTLTGRADYVNNRRVQAVGEEEEDTEVYEDKVVASVKPEASYNFTNNVDARFWTQYIYEKIFNTDKQPHTHDLEIHGEFTMRF